MTIQMPDTRPDHSDRSGAHAEISISIATIGDAPALRALHELSLVMLAADAYSPRQIHRLFVTRDTAPPGMIAAGRMLVARRHGFVVGSAGWEPRRFDGQPGAHLRSVFVHPLLTRQGVASALVRAVETRAMERHAIRFTLAATVNAVPLYRRLGYAAVAHGNLDLGDGLSFPVVHMARRVQSAHIDAED
ncbi:GNAT family N-acetyltransferase [Halovulum dunhuangense]|uniref:GNAT family N-acetyltransferase n=1 Tax=Halovulum dunhuangense TaxID=1505036 RepID=A0A849L279_9RHOB|nr:GNAT family N-acetyltransferase [Halovulum dunhuangense]NNU80438.1 GNAT family N-acetyltransferase [Halovulum dunhuangense]